MKYKMIVHRAVYAPLGQYEKVDPVSANDLLLCALLDAAADKHGTARIPGVGHCRLNPREPTVYYYLNERL